MAFLGGLPGLSGGCFCSDRVSSEAVSIALVSLLLASGAIKNALDESLLSLSGLSSSIMSSVIGTDSDNSSISGSTFSIVMAFFVCLTHCLGFKDTASLVMGRVFCDDFAGLNDF